MSEKKPFIEPRIVADHDIEVADRDFPLTPLTIPASGSASDVSDFVDGATPNGLDAGLDGDFPDGLN